VCWVCGRRAHWFQCVTFVGAPVGGIPVHRRCVLAFFKRLDEGTLPAKPHTLKRERACES
jgi:hypothetical protein